MPIYKRKLSGSTDGMPVLVEATATAGTLIHTAVAGTDDGTYDEIYIFAENNHTLPVTLTIEYGDATTSHNIITTLASKSGLQLIIPGLILQNSMTIKAFAGTASVISLSGFVNRMTD